MNLDDSGVQLSEVPSLEGLEPDDVFAEIWRWWVENFEPTSDGDPSVRGDSLRGGAIEPDEYLPDYFPDLEEDQLWSVIGAIYDESRYWQPITATESGYRDSPQSTPKPNLEERLDELDADLDLLKDHVSQILKLQQETSAIAGIGHNNPPPDEKEEITLSEVLESLNEVKAELGKPRPLRRADEAVLEDAEGRLAAFELWFTGLVKRSPTLIAESAIVGAGASAFNYAWSHQDEIFLLLSKVVPTIRDWAVYLSAF